MLLKLFKRLARAVTPKQEDRSGELTRAHEIANTGDMRSAAKAYKAYLEHDPGNVEALNGLGACLADIGDLAQAQQIFELAASLDDTYIQASVNRAKLLVDTNRGEEALVHLRRAKIYNPDFIHADAVYAGLLLRLGLPARARRFQMKAWTASFNNLRLANCYLFWTSYDDVDDTLIAAEHRFWAETLPVPDITLRAGPQDDAPPEPPPSLARPAGGKVRIGYFSPDIRSHSVRFFFRPLLEAHDRERFEVFIYHDFPTSDAQTEAARERADAFHPVSDLTDAQLCALMRSHNLDVLVELAGHTSANRLNLLAHRMATVQITALGYPPTTGLDTVDAKIIDAHVSTPRDGELYAEEAVALPSSFWCFDPKEDIPVTPEPPCVANGHITFGCAGNIAKISQPVAQTWIRILDAVPASRLRIRSISFEDSLALRVFREQLADWGLPMERIDLLGPAGGVSYFRSYDEIDLALDTFPFNGGTTTSFAVYMGVPVVTMAGESLVSRMGASILTNAGAPELVVRTLDEYVAVAIRLANDVEALRTFRREVRGRIARNGLGNAEIYTREFEQAVLDLLERKRAGQLPRHGRIAALPAKEIMRRAYEVLRRGNEEGASRIVEHCLRHYPDHGAAHLLKALQVAWAGDVDAANAYLLERIDRFAPADQVSAWLTIARHHLLVRDTDEARAAVAHLEGCSVEDPFDAAQLALTRAACAAPTAPRTPEPPPVGWRTRVVIPCDDGARFEQLRAELLQAIDVPQGGHLEVVRCDEHDRHASYAELAGAACDAVVLLQRNIRVMARDLLTSVWQGLQQADVLGFAGADRWDRLDWRLDVFERKAGCFMVPSMERPGAVDLRLLGPGRARLSTGMAVLDGGLLAMRPQALASAAWDEKLLGCDTLLEEAWTHAAGQGGQRLGVHRGLGVLLDTGHRLDDRDRLEAREHYVQVRGFDPLDTPDEDHLALSVPVADGAQALQVVERYLDA